VAFRILKPVVFEVDTSPAWWINYVGRVVTKVADIITKCHGFFVKYIINKYTGFPSFAREIAQPEICQCIITGFSSLGIYQVKVLFTYVIG
jgi:hypothetical protein